MISGEFTHVPLEQIVVNREERQRRELEEIPELAQSIAKNGLIHPIVITRDFRLIAGERRYAAHKLLGADVIAVQFVEDLPEEALQLLELEENIKRVDLTWQDKTAAIARYHALQTSVNPEWSQQRTGEELGIEQNTVSGHLLVQEAVEAAIPEVTDSPQFSTALNFCRRREERKKTSGIRELQDEINEVFAPSDEPDSPPEEPVGPKRYAEILHGDFLTWAKEVRDTPYNFIHCDFPYGVTAGDKVGLSPAKSFGGYEDSAEIFDQLLASLLRNQDNFIAPSAHMLFWLSADMTIVRDTAERISGAGWVVQPFPIIWHKSDNAGILSDPNRRPRHTYEAALFCTRGDRKLVRAKADSFSGPTTKTYHMSEKPLAMLEHFMRMLIDTSSRVLDPTCGSGNAIKVAEQLGARWSTGIEKSEEYVKFARENLEL